MTFLFDMILYAIAGVLFDVLMRLLLIGRKKYGWKI